MNLKALINYSVEEPTVLIYQTGIKEPSQSLAYQIDATDIVDPGSASRKNTVSQTRISANFDSVLKHYNCGVLHNATSIKEYQSVFDELCQRCDRVIVFKHDIWGNTLGREADEVFNNIAVYYNTFERFSENQLGPVDLDAAVRDFTESKEEPVVMSKTKTRKQKVVKEETPDFDETTTAELSGFFGESNDPF